MKIPAWIAWALLVGLKLTFSRDRMKAIGAGLFSVCAAAGLAITGFTDYSKLLHDDKAIGLGGHCTWDEEHGYGVLIRNNKVAAVGQESEAFA